MISPVDRYQVSAALVVIAAVLLASAAGSTGGRPVGQMRTLQTPGPAFIANTNGTEYDSPSGATVTLNYSLIVGDFILAQVLEDSGGPPVIVSTSAGETYTNSTLCSSGTGTALVQTFYGKVGKNASQLILTPNFAGPFAGLVLTYSGVDYGVSFLDSTTSTGCSATTGTTMVQATDVGAVGERMVFSLLITVASGFSVNPASTVAVDTFDMNAGRTWTGAFLENNETTIPTNPQVTVGVGPGPKDAALSYLGLVPLRRLALIASKEKGAASAGSVLLAIAPSNMDVINGLNCLRPTDILVIMLTLSSSTSVSFSGSSGFGAPRTVIASTGLLSDFIYIATVNGGCPATGLQVFLLFGASRAYSLSLFIFRNAKSPVPEGEFAVENGIASPVAFSIDLDASRPYDLMAAAIHFQSSDTATAVRGETTSKWTSAGAGLGAGIAQPAGNLVCNFTATESTNPGNVDMLAVVIGAQYFPALVVDFTWIVDAPVVTFHSTVSGNFGTVNYSWDFDLSNLGANVSFLANPQFTYAPVARSYCVRLNVSDPSPNTGSVTHCGVTIPAGGGLLGVASWAFWLLLFFALLVVGVVASYRLRKYWV